MDATTGTAMAWVVWTCEGNTFESHLPAAEAADRLAELQADDTVTDAHIDSA